MNGGPFNVSIRGPQRECALTGKIPPYSAPAAFGRFEVLHQVGAGVLGPVFLARDPERSRSVAVKVFRLDITPEQTAELVSQLGLLARANLAHPSIIAPFDAGLEDTTAYLAEEYVAADSLDSAIRQYGPAPVSQAIRILAAVAGALDFAAAVGVHHGALHPRDLLVTPDDTRVTGFGIGRALEAVGLRAPMRRPYVAPERVQREGWDGRADVYSLGVLARELLAGRSAKPDSEPPLPDDQAERLQPVLARATAARPADRFSTCLEFIGAVQDAIAGAEAHAAPVAGGGLLARAGKARHRATHDLLLPLDGDERAEADETPAGDAGRLRLDDPEVVPDLPSPGEAPRVVAPLPDLDLHASAPAERSVDAFDLSELDKMVPVPPPFDRMAGMAPLPGSGMAELGEPVDLPARVGEADRPERFGDVFATTPEPEPAAEPTSDEPPIFPPEMPDRPLFAAQPPAHVRARPRSLGWPLVAVTMLIVGFMIGYFVGSRSKGPEPVPAAAPASSQPAAPGSTSAPAAQPPAGPPGTAPATPAAPNRAVTPAPAAVVHGVLYIRSTPRGASVLLNGRVRGVTPVHVRNVAAGRYAVRVTRRGYAADEREVVVSADRPSSTLDFSLHPASATQPASRTGLFGTLSIESLPSGARVFVDGHLIGSTPLVDVRVAVGPHVIRVDRAGFRPWTTPIQIVTGQRTAKTASLEREQQ